MLEHYTRNYYQLFFVDPIARLLLRFGCHKPNQITLAAAIIGILAAITLYFHWPIIACILLLLSGYLDTLDGTLARMTNNSTALGSVLDIMADRLVEFVIILGLYSIAPLSRATLCLWLLGSILLCVTSFLVVGIFTEKDSHKGFFYSPGLIERPEAFLFFIAMILLPTIFNWLGWILTLLVFYTAILRILQFYKQHTQFTGKINANS
jgi:phosphatidylglycerophosphate synthase